jgi:hypothetical protein
MNTMVFEFTIHIRQSEHVADFVLPDQKSGTPGDLRQHGIDIIHLKASELQSCKVEVEAFLECRKS